jgi:hypothetical protein
VAAGNAAATDSVQVTRAAPDARGGQAYRVTYQVDLPLAVYWRFKTDFDNTFLETNPYILSGAPHFGLYIPGGAACVLF